MSTRNTGMVGKTYKTTLEAFKDAEYATAIQRPESSHTTSFWGFIFAMVFVSVFAYGFWLTISRF